MKICIWRTGHEIADTVADAVNEAVPADKLFLDLDTDEVFPLEADVHIGYGILRDMDTVWRECERHNKPYFIVDRGYWKPGHYDGYYRVSLCGTQQTSGWPEPDYARWDTLGLEIEPYRERSGYTLVCPPTAHVDEFFDVKWWCEPKPNMLYRPKDCKRSLEDDLAGASRVSTFNSSVAWEALRRGIPMQSDSEYSMLGAWIRAKNLDNIAAVMDSRRELFATQAAMQMTLEEMRRGRLFPLIQKLLPARNLSTSGLATIVAKPNSPTFAPIQSRAAPKLKSSSII